MSVAPTSIDSGSPAPRASAPGEDAHRTSTAKAILKLIRPHQWVKNVLVFLALILAHKVNRDESHRIFATIFAFIAFCLCASGVYVLNDWLDVEADRQHRTKRNRPFASGALPLSFGPPLCIVLTVAAFGIAATLVSLRFTGMLAVYTVLTILYSCWLKRKLLLDVMVLAGLYTLRIIAGAVAADVALTFWLLAFSIFFFLSLAYAKRYAELMGLKSLNQVSAAGRNYTAEDLSIFESVGPASGYAAVLVLALYINSGMVKTLYQRPWILWLLCPLLLYWITRLWFLARRGSLHEDPVIFAIKDRVSWMMIAACAVVVAAATVPWFLTAQ